MKRDWSLKKDSDFASSQSKERTFELFEGKPTFQFLGPKQSPAKIFSLGLSYTDLVFKGVSKY